MLDTKGVEMYKGSIPIGVQNTKSTNKMCMFTNHELNYTLYC